MSFFGWALFALVPHGQCYEWLSSLIALHAVSDSLIALAYFSIPVALLRFVRKRPDTPFPQLFWLFGSFIIACGLTHLLEVWSIWYPHYWTSGWLKLLTGLISVATAVVSIRVLPDAVRLRSPREMELERRDLEIRVQQRTKELEAANERLRLEVAQRETAEGEVRRLAASLQNRLDEMQTLFDLLPVGVGLATTADCSDIRINERFSIMLGISKQRNASLSASEAEKPTTFRVLHEGRELPPQELPIQRAARENREIRDFEEVIERSDGVTLHAIANAVPLRDAEGRVRGCVACFLDISERKEAERRRAESRKLESLGILAGGIAHDFNNLLTGMLGNATLLAEMLPEHRVATPLLQEIESAAERAADLCRQMLAYAGKGRFMVRMLNVNYIIKGEDANLRSLLGPDRELVLELDPALPQLKGDVLQVRQLLLNLAHNAIEAMALRGRRLSLRTGTRTLDENALAQIRHAEGAVPGNFVWLEVEDEGVGMDETLLPHIFDPFFTTKFTGRGLGLPAALGIIRAHRGALQVDSVPQKGTIMRVFLPLLPNEVTFSPFPPAK